MNGLPARDMNPGPSINIDQMFPRGIAVWLGVVVLAVIGIVALLVWSGYRAAIDSAETRTRDYAAILEARLNATLRRVDAELFELAREIPAAALNQAAVARHAPAINAELDNRLFKFKEIVGFRVADRDGAMLYSSASASTPKINASDLSFFRQLRDNPRVGLVFSGAHTGRISGRRVMLAARAFTDERGQFAGAVFAPIELDYAQGLFDSLTLGSQGFVALRRSDDHRLVAGRPHPADQINQPLSAQHPLVARIAASESRATMQYAAQTDGVERIFSYQRFDGYPFYVNVGLARDEVLAEWRQRSLAIGVPGLMLLGALAWLLRRLAQTRLREHQALGALRESERFAHGVLDALSSHIAVLDDQGRILATNRRWREFAQQNDLSADTVGEGAHYLAVCQLAAQGGDACAKAAVRLIEDLISGQRVEGDFEYPCHAPHEQRWFVCRGTRFDGDGPIRVVVSHGDITARKLAETGLRASENQFRAMFEQAAVGIAHVAHDGRFLKCNQRLCDIVGYSAQELAQKTFQDISDPADLSLSLAWRERLLQGDVASYTLEKRYVRKSGESVWVSLTSNLIRPMDGADEYTFAVVENIHLRKLTELGLQALASEHRGDAFLQHVTLALATLLEVEFAFVGEVNASTRQVTTRTMCADGQWVPNFSYDLEGTPCEGVVGKETCIFSANVQQQFPRDTLLGAMGIMSYAAVPLWDSEHTALGLLGIMSRQPLRNAEAVSVLLQLFTIRVGAELEREHGIAEITGVRDQLSLALDASRIALWHWDSDSDCISLDVGWVRILGQAPRERYAVGADLAAMVHPDDLAATAQMQIDCLRGVVDEYRIEHRVRVADGSWTWIETRGRVVARDAQGRGLRMVGTNLDISERKQAEGALRKLNQELETKVLARTADLQLANAVVLRREEEIRSVVENLVDCVISIDAQGVIRSANPAVEKVLGYSVAEVIGRNVSLLMPEPHRTAHDAYLERYHRTGQARIIGIGREVEGLHKNGTRIAMELSVNEYFVGGQRFFTGILRDVRERVRFVAELNQARLDAEQASQAKSAILAAMSHEIRTPMNGVIGMVDVLHQTSLKGYQVEIVDTIRDSAYSLLGVIEDILDFSKIEAGKLEVEQIAMSVSDVVEQVCKMLELIAAKKGVEFTLFTDPRIPQQVLGDPQRLRQVLINLVNNAIKFSSGSQDTGRVSVRARLVKHDADEVTVEIEVTDNGIGMDEATQSELFTAFHQGDVSTTRRFGGTGLGLAISGQLVQLMGGEVLVRSVPAQGATFTVRLVFARLPSTPDQSVATSEVTGLSCIVIGKALGLADDLGAYLEHGGAHVQRVFALVGVRDLPCASAQSVWVVDAADEPVSADQLRDAAAAWGAPDARFVLIGRGRRRQQRAIAFDQVVVDGNVLTRQILFAAVALAAGRAPAPAPLVEPFEEELVTGISVPTHEEARREGRVILVAEDNETNQQVIRLQLALLGYAADVVGNGREALECWRRGDYALVLTDLHMPQMDGYQLAAAIRAEEKGLRHTPIVALSANALAGEGQRCREIGMDDYLSKPTPLERLKRTLSHWMPGAPAISEPGAVRTVQTATRRVVDIGVLKSLVGDDALLIDKVLRSFQADLPVLAAEVRSACHTGQPRATAAAAHKLKSAARAVGALQLGALCDDMEQAGKGADQHRLAALLPGFEQALASVTTALQALLPERANSAPGLSSVNPLMERAVIRIMLLDDEPFMLALIGELLATLGFTTLSAYGSAAEALASFGASGTAPELILLDLNMPDMDGIEFARQLAERRYTGSLVLISGEDERTLQAASKLLQAHRITVLGTLHKPVSAPALLALIDTWTPPPSVARALRGAKAAYDVVAVRAAIANGELVNYYQPKVALADGRVVGVETLVRWRHPTDGLVFPDQFIGVAEAHGLIDDLTRVVLHEALAQARAWHDGGLALRVAVNVSMDNLSTLSFADFFTTTAAAAGVAAPQVVLEVTESRLMADLRVPLEILTRLRLRRFRLSIDDFGTGHSSLAQLRDMPFDELKIDRSFVHGAHADPTLRAIVESNLLLARQLGMEVVAEGIEDRGDWDFLRSSGCDLAQGYFIARPMLAAELAGWIAAWQARMLDF